MDGIGLRKLTEDDYDSVMKIREAEDVYHGWDYLPDYYLTMINSSEITGYCACVNGKMICGVLAHVVDDRKTLVLRGARVSKEHVGMGIFRTLHKCIVDEYLSYGTLQKAITFNNENVDMINQVKKGNYSLIMEKNIIVYKNKKNDIIYTGITQGVRQENEYVSGRKRGFTKQLNNVDLENIMSDDVMRQRLFPDDRLVVDWVPFRPVISNVSQILTERCRCIGTNVDTTESNNNTGCDNKPLLTFGNSANCKNGLLYRLDIYGDGYCHIEKHLSRTIDHIAELKHYDTILQLFCYEGADKDHVMNKFGFCRLPFYETKQYCAEKPMSSNQ